MSIAEEIGKYFGYPLCCIQAFEVILVNAGRKKPEQRNPLVHKHTGFIPCPDHAKQILEGKITLESLISGRICPHEFPEDGTMEELDEHLALQAQ